MIIKTNDIMWIVGGDEQFQRCFIFSICKALNPLNVLEHNQNNVGRGLFKCGSGGGTGGPDPPGKSQVI